MMKYQVIIVLDESRNRSYYYSYVAENGNIECEDLPPYQDINKARSCYWNVEDTTWIYDEDKYTELMETQAAEKEAAEREAAATAATPTNQELAIGLMELGKGISTLMDAVTVLADKIAE